MNIELSTLKFLKITKNLIFALFEDFNIIEYYFYTKFRDLNTNICCDQVKILKIKIGTIKVVIGLKLVFHNKKSCFFI